MLDQLDLLLINPGGREKIYQQLAGDLTAIEPPLWCRLIAGYVLDRGFSVEIIDAEALNIGVDALADTVAARAPRLTAMVVFGHQPSASTQQMAAASAACKAIKTASPDQPLIILGGHVSALPERTLDEEAVDYACNGEGPATVHQLLQAMTAQDTDLGAVAGLIWRDDQTIANNPPAALITDMDGDLHGNALAI
jgi:radical SAM superfamily enzyme YgiQ (UPF0313 family)